MALKRLVLIRVGETDWNLAGRWQGWVAAPLNANGRAQMERLSGFLKHIEVRKLYSSDHRRATDSAEILMRALEGAELIFDERLRERAIGFFQGLTVPEIHGWYPDAYRELLRDPENFRMPLGESLADVRERVCQALDEIIADAEDAEQELTVGILSHTTTIRVIIKQLLPEFDLTNVTFFNSSVTTLVREGGWKLTALNDLMHLDGIESRHMPIDFRGDDRHDSDD
jgi:probable phosphoglycerate mutase